MDRHDALEAYRFLPRERRREIVRRWKEWKEIGIERMDWADFLLTEIANGTFYED